MPSHEQYIGPKYEAIIADFEQDLGISNAKIKRLQVRHHAPYIAAVLAIPLCIGFVAYDLNHPKSSTVPYDAGDVEVQDYLTASRDGFFPLTDHVDTTKRIYSFSQSLGHCGITVTQVAVESVQPAGSDTVMTYTVNSPQSNFMNVIVPDYAALKKTDLYTGCVVLDAPTKPTA